MPRSTCRVLPAFERFLEIMRTEPEIVDAPDAVDIGRIRGDISLNDVSFTYDSAEVLHHVSLRAEAGKTLALIGRPAAVRPRSAS